MNKKLYTAIIFFTDNSAPQKYRKIGNQNSFITFASAKANVWYCNWYEKETKQYAGRHYFINI